MTDTKSRVIAAPGRRRTHRLVRAQVASGAMVAVALWLVWGCGKTDVVARGARDRWARLRTEAAHSVEAGATIDVTLDHDISSECVAAGAPWHGTVTEDVMTRDGGVIPVGSEVEGAIVAVTATGPGSRAMLELDIRSVCVNGHDESIGANAEPVLAADADFRGSVQVAGVEAPDAQVGGVASEARIAAVGDLLVDPASAAVVTGEKGRPVVLIDGTVLRFTVRHAVPTR